MTRQVSVGVLGLGYRGPNLALGQSGLRVVRVLEALQQTREHSVEVAPA